MEQQARTGSQWKPAHLIPFRIKVIILDFGFLLLLCGSKVEREERRGGRKDEKGGKERREEGRGGRRGEEGGENGEGAWRMKGEGKDVWVGGRGVLGGSGKEMYM